MCYKTQTIVAVLVLIITVGCSTLESMVYHPDINQGNYLAANDISKIHIGMTQQQVANTLGTPMMKSLFNSNVWYYVFRHQSSHKKIMQQTLRLIFNRSGVLTNIEKKLPITV